MGNQTVRFAIEATRWLGIWLDFLVKTAAAESAKPRRADARLGRVVSKHGVPPAAARNFRIAIVQGVVLYASELT